MKENIEQPGQRNSGDYKEGEQGLFTKIQFRRDTAIAEGEVCILAGFNYFDWTAPIRHLTVDEERMEEMRAYYQARKRYYEQSDNKKIPSAVSAAYDTYLYANGGINDEEAVTKEASIYEKTNGPVHLSEFYGTRAMICGEASIFALQLMSVDIPTQLVFGYMGDEPHAFLLVEIEDGGDVGIFDVNNGDGVQPLFIDFPREHYNSFVNSEISVGLSEDVIYTFEEGKERRLYDPLQTRRG